MSHYKDLLNKVHFLEDDAFAYLLPIGCVKISDDEASNLNAPTLTQARITQCGAMEVAYTAAVGAPIDYMGSTFQADAGSRDLLAQTIAACGGALPTGFQWYDVNNAGVTMNFAQLQGLAASILMRGQPLFVNKQVKKAAINAATSVSAVQAITF